MAVKTRKETEGVEGWRGGGRSYSVAAGGGSATVRSAVGERRSVLGRKMAWVPADDA